MWRVLRALLIIVAVLTVSGHSGARDRELTESPDFRVRVQAALRLGRSGPAARADLEEGLRDAHPAVRVACAVGLGTIGDPAAIPALEAAMRNESFASAKQTMSDTIAKLRSRAGGGGGGGGTTIDNAKYVVQLGQLRNTTGIRPGDLDAVMRQAAKAKATSIKGAVIVDGSDAAVVKRASDRQIPVLQLDGNLVRLTQSKARDGGLIVSAQVDLTVRKVPQQILKGMVKGNASATDDARASNRAILELQNRAVGGAVESAMNSINSDIATLAK